MQKFLIILIFALSSYNAESQNFYRIEADFVMKVKTSAGQQQLTVGKIFYDKNVNQIVYEISFPEKEIWVQKDTILYRIVNSVVIGKQTIPTMLEFSIFSLVLNGHLADYGLKKTRFVIKNVEKVGNSVISTWEPPKELKIIFGDVLLANVNQQLDGIIFKSSTGAVISRQFFRNYTKVKGLSFPQEIIKEMYVAENKNIEITTFTNILINDFSGTKKYDYKIPEL
jgi:hypothetical protein